MCDNHRRSCADALQNREDSVQRDPSSTFDEGIELGERGRPQAKVRLP